MKEVLKQTSSWNIPFQQCKRFVLRRSKQPGNVLVRGELHYKSDIAKPQNICSRNKNISQITPQLLPNKVAVNKNKLSDVQKLLENHFGNEWKDISALSFYKNLLEEQESLDAPTVEDIFCTEALEEVPDLRI